LSLRTFELVIDGHLPCLLGQPLEAGVGVHPGEAGVGDQGGGGGGAGRPAGAGRRRLLAAGAGAGAGVPFLVAAAAGGLVLGHV